MKRLMLVLLATVAFAACQLVTMPELEPPPKRETSKPTTFAYPSWLFTGQWQEITTADFPSYWYFESDRITLQYQDPYYQYITVWKYLDFSPRDSTFSAQGDTFTFANSYLSVAVTRISAGVVSVAETFSSGNTYVFTYQATGL